MTRVLIVDDEVVFRNSIKAMLDWEEYGFELCGEASDGVTAKQMIEVLRPDIVITDIKMPGVGGISVIKFINENHTDIQVIALSGYDDYEYVRTSLKNGVVDYLLKHSINNVSLLSVLQTAQKRINKAVKTKLDSERMQKQIAFGRNVIRQRFLANLLEGQMTDSNEIAKQARELSLPIGSAIMMLVAAEIDAVSLWKSQNSQAEWQSLFDKIIELVNENLPEEAMLAPQSDSGFVILFSMRNSYSELSFRNSVNDCVSRVRSSLKRHYNVTACYSISGRVASPAHIKQAYERVRAALGEKIYRDYDIIIHDSTIPESPHCNYDIGFTDEQNIVQFIKSGNRRGVIDYIEDIFRNIRDCGLDSIRVQLIVAHLINLLNRTLREFGADLISVNPQFHYVYQNLKDMTLNEMQQGVIECYICTMSYLERFGEANNYHDVTSKAIVYISQNHVKDISLDAIAKSVHTSASYLSRVFKEDTGKGVVEYINWMRVEHAKQLISEGIKVNELSKITGFNSDTYFYTVFKSNTGKTPKKYKDELVQSSN